MGLGPIGQRLTRYLLERKGIAIVGAVDPAPDKAGKDLGKLCCRKKMGVIISPGLAFTMKKTEADVAIISTVSSLEKVEEQIKEAADHSLNIISTCEELSYPWNTRPGWASRIDAYCKKHKVSCLGTGVNPGFLMDYLPAVLTSVCQKVEHIKVERVQDAQHRRLPFQKKIGVGLSEAEFRKKEAFLRHDGLPESVYMTAGALNWKLDKVEETRTPIIAGHDIQNGNSLVSKGRVAGLRQTAKGYRENKELISLVFQAAVDRKSVV